MAYNGFAIDKYLNAAEVTRQLDELIKKPVYSVRPDKLKMYEEEYFEKKCSKSKAMITEAKKVIPGGVQHNLAFNYPFPIVIEKAEGARLYDIDGNWYYDLLQAGGPTILGSNMPEVREKGIDPKSLRLRIGIFGAEPWTEEMRREIEKALAIKAYDIYGLSEIAGPGVAYDCEMQDGLHINEDYFYPEVIDPDTLQPLPDGEYGELVFTCIGKEALPLVRYRTRDICALHRAPCACGRTTVRMSKPRGRSDDMLIIRGVNVFPSQVEHVLLELGMDPNYLILVDRKNNLDTMEVQVEMNAALFSDTVRDLESVEHRIEGALQSTLNVHAKVRLVEPGALPRSEGKAKRVIDNRAL